MRNIPIFADWCTEKLECVVRVLLERIWPVFLDP